MIYEYECENCQIIFEKNHSIKNNPEFKCPDCGNKLERIISNNGNVVLKGWGWGSKDSKRKNNFMKNNEKRKEKARKDGYSNKY